MNGFSGKILFVDLSSQKIEQRDLPSDIAESFLGGSALGARILYEEMPANTNVFGEDSMIGFVPGLFNNTPALFGEKYSIVSKAPDHDGWGDAFSNGLFGSMIKKAGYDAIFIRGISERPVYLWVNDNNIEIREASAIWGKPISESEQILKEELGNDKIIASIIGPAGEGMSWISTVMNDTYHAARGGSAAVMGSKKLKAIACYGSQKNEIMDYKILIEANKGINEFMKKTSVKNKKICLKHECFASFESDILLLDKKSIMMLDQICNEYGLNIISAKDVLTWAVDCFSEGILTKEELDGLEPEWDNFQTIIDLLMKIVKIEGCGKILAQGSHEASKILGKGQELLSISKKDKDHSNKKTSKFQPLSYHKFTLSGYADLSIVVNREVLNASGLCNFSGAVIPSSIRTKMIEAVLGIPWSMRDEWDFGQRSWLQRHVFNWREGKKEDKWDVDARLMKHSSFQNMSSHEDISQFEKLKDQFYSAMGLNENGKPEKEILQLVGGLDHIIKDIYPS